MFGGTLAGLGAGLLHGVLKAGVDKVHLGGALDNLGLLLLRNGAVGIRLDEVEHHLLALLLPLLVEAAEADVREVLEPLEVRHSHSTGVQEQVRDHDLALLAVSHVLHLRGTREIGDER